MNKSRVFIFGAGLVGRLIHDELQKHEENLPFSSVLINDRIQSSGDVERVFDTARRTYGEPFVFINAIGKTGTPNVDWCEDHKEETFLANVEVPLLLAEAAWKERLPLIHVSSGCIFNGSGPFRAESIPNFDGSYYSYTKLQAENRLQMMARHYSSFSNNSGARLELHRIRMPFMAYPDPRNLLTKLESYDTIVEAPNSITYMPDYVRMVMLNLQKTYVARGMLMRGSSLRIINATNPGAITHRQIVEMMDEASGKKSEKKYITPEDLNAIVRVPRTNCVLEATKGGIAIPIEHSMRHAIREYFKPRLEL